MELELRLRDILKERGIEQRQLSEMTGLSVRTISELCNNKSKQYPKAALEKIMSALDITSLDDLFVTKK